MRRGAASAMVLLLVLLPAVQGTEHELESRPGPGVAILVHHPHPDPSDILGFPWPGDGDEDRDGFVARHPRFGTDGRFDFPVFVADGTLGLEGLAEGADPEAATTEAYRQRIEARRAEAAPVVLEVLTFVRPAGGDRPAQLMFNGTVVAGPGADLEQERLRAMAAVVEDPVHYEPPASQSNGIVDHPFTTRALADLGTVAPRSGAPANARHVFDLEPDWDPERLWLAFWVQSDFGARYDAGEVVQATMHPATAGYVTRQADKGVLVEAYSATWCQPCLHGDRAIETLAQEYGVVLEGRQEPGAGYFEAPGAAAGVLALAVAAAAVYLVSVQLGRGRAP